MINIFEPSMWQDELNAIAGVFERNWPGKGAKVTEFEAAWAKHIGVDPAHVVSVNSCTEGLFMAVKLSGVNWEDAIIMPSIHFIGAAQAVLGVNSYPIFCDVDCHTLNATAETIRAKLNRRTGAIILNHYGGLPCEAGGIVELCNYDDITIIEDAACAPASTYDGRAVGTLGDFGVWSFDSMKLMSTGDGGMIYCKRIKDATQMRQWLYLGTNTTSGLSSQADRWWEFEVRYLGARRSIMNDIAAAIGLEQLKKLPRFIARRKEVKATYDKELAGVGDIVLPPPVDVPYFYWIQTERRDELAQYLKANGIYTTFRYYPLHWAYRTGDTLPAAERAAQVTLLLPMHQGLSDDDVALVVEKVKEFYERN